MPSLQIFWAHLCTLHGGLICITLCLSVCLWLDKNYWAIIHISKSIAPRVTKFAKQWTWMTPMLTWKFKVIGQRSRSPGQKTWFVVSFYSCTGNIKFTYSNELHYNEGVRLRCQYPVALLRKSRWAHVNVKLHFFYFRPHEPHIFIVHADGIPLPPDLFASQSPLLPDFYCCEEHSQPWIKFDPRPPHLQSVFEHGNKFLYHMLMLLIYAELWLCNLNFLLPRYCWCGSSMEFILRFNDRSQNLAFLQLNCSHGGCHVFWIPWLLCSQYYIVTHRFVLKSMPDTRFSFSFQYKI